MPGQSQINKEKCDDEREGQRRCENDRVDRSQRLRAKPGKGAGLLGGGRALAALVIVIGGNMQRE